MNFFVHLGSALLMLWLVVQLIKIQKDRKQMQSVLKAYLLGRNDYFFVDWPSKGLLRLLKNIGYSCEFETRDKAPIPIYPARLLSLLARTKPKLIRYESCKKDAVTLSFVDCQEEYKGGDESPFGNKMSITYKKSDT